jgi:Ca2+-binding EF-hand superfamily protein
MLTDLQRAKLTRYFHMYDVDDDGVVGRKDFERILENLRQLYGLGEGDPRYQAIRESYLQQWEGLVEFADIDADGTVDPDEWLAYFTGVLGDSDLYEAAITSLVFELLNFFDTDEDGVLGADEFVNFYGLFGRSAAMARQVFLGLDRDADGQITVEELMLMAQEFFRGDNPDAPGTALFGLLDD